MNTTCCIRLTPANNARTRGITSERPLAVTRRPVALHTAGACGNARTRRITCQRPLAVTRRPVALHTAGACGNASTRWRCIRRALAITRRPAALHTAGACDNASTRWRCIRRPLATTRRPVALHTAGACDNASTRRDAYQGPLILMVPVLGSDSYLCLLRTWVRMNLARGSPPQGDLCPCHDRRRDCSSSCPDGAEMELRTLPSRSEISKSSRRSLGQPTLPAVPASPCPSDSRLSCRPSRRAASLP
jgi:hypothetical protein